MAHPYYAVRPQLVDGDAIRLAIATAGLTHHDRGRIADFLMDSYIVDLDLLNAVLSTGESFSQNMTKHAA